METKQANKVLPDTWDGFNKTSARDLAFLDPEEIGLTDESQTLFKIWSLIVRHPELNKQLSKIISSINIDKDPDEANTPINEFIDLIGEGETMNESSKTENPNYRSSGLLKTFYPSKLVEDNYELKTETYPGKSPREIFRILFENGWNDFKKDATERFPNKKDDTQFINKIARIHAARNWLENQH